ncbi:hypothetical protein ACXR2U_23465 [Jatrophihabitans sp. YIM 134969]
MIAAAAFCPGTPVLVPVPGAAAPDPALARVRAAASTAVASLAGLDRIVVLGPGATSLLHSPVAEGTLAGFGLDVTVHLGSPACGATDPLPLSLTVGAWLLREAFGPSSGAVGVACGSDFASSPAAADLLGLAATDDRIGLLAVVDGAERFPPLDGPGHTAADIARSGAASAALDDRLARALSDGDGDTLADLPGAPPLTHLGSLAAWRAAGSLLAGPGVTAELLAREDVHGVGWLVARWELT